MPLDDRALREPYLYLLGRFLVVGRGPAVNATERPPRQMSGIARAATVVP